MTTMFAQPPQPPAFSGPSAPAPIQTTPPPQLYASQAQFTPPSSSETISNVQSPVSPRTSWSIPQHLQMPTRQIRQRQGPMYVPAVLRPTEKPARSSPPKGSAAYGSPESMDEFGGADRPAGIVPHLSRIVTEEWNEEVLGPVTGTPSRNHWKVRKFPIFFMSVTCAPSPITCTSFPTAARHGEDHPNSATAGPGPRNRKRACEHAYTRKQTRPT